MGEKVWGALWEDNIGSGRWVSLLHCPFSSLFLSLKDFANWPASWSPSLPLYLFSFPFSWRRCGTKQGGEIYTPAGVFCRERKREQKGNKGTLAGTQHWHEWSHALDTLVLLLHQPPPSCSSCFLFLARIFNGLLFLERERRSKIIFLCAARDSTCRSSWAASILEVI